MSTRTPPLPTHRSHRHTRSAALPNPAVASQNPQHPYYLNLKSHDSNLQLGMAQSSEPTTPPRTPQKTEHSTPSNNGYQFPGSNSVPKPRSKGKNRLKNATTSPTASRIDRSTPPLTGTHSGGISTSTRPISTPSNTAYAGPTFHASPAPSALPIPSFYSKSVPDSPDIKTMQKQKEESSSTSIDSPTPPPARTATAQPEREESPLDIFFKADREEKARARSASSFRGSSLESGSFLLPSDSPLNKYDNALTGSQGRTRNTHFSGGSTSALFAMELDGANSPGKPYGPTFSTPYIDQINAARSSATPLQSQSQRSQEQQKSTERSEALKAYLFSPETRSPPVASSNDSSTDQSSSDSTSHNTTSTYRGQRSAPPPSRLNRNSFPHLNDAALLRHSPRGGSRSSGLRQEVSSSATTTAQIPDQVAGSYSTPLNPSQLPPQGSRSSSRNSSNNFDSTRSSVFTSTSHRGTSLGSHSTDYKEMEDSLRRILKLEPVPDISVQTADISRVPEPAISTPNFIGGRGPPMEGVQNGVMGS